MMWCLTNMISGMQLKCVGIFQSRSACIYKGMHAVDCNSRTLRCSADTSVPYHLRGVGPCNRKPAGQTWGCGCAGLPDVPCIRYGNTWTPCSACLWNFRASVVGHICSTIYIPIANWHNRKSKACKHIGSLMLRNILPSVLISKLWHDQLMALVPQWERSLVRASVA